MWGNDEAVKMNATFYSSFSSNFSAQTPSDEVVFDKEYDILEKLVIGTVFFYQYHVKRDDYFVGGIFIY